jgi:hypothetical protein
MDENEGHESQIVELPLLDQTAQPIAPGSIQFGWLLDGSR